MKIKNRCVYLLTLFVTLSLVACVDSKYDLADIDSTAGVKVKDLAVSVSLDAIILENIVDIEDHKQIKVVNGEYAFWVDGVVEKNNFDIPSFTIAAPAAKSTTRTISLAEFGIDPPSLTEGDIAIYNDISDNFRLYHAEIENEASFDIKEENVNAAVVKIDTIGTDNFQMKMSISISELKSILNSIEIYNLTIQLPKGLTVTVSDNGIYDPATGILTFDESIKLDSNLEKDFTFNIFKIDAKQAGIELVDGALSFTIESTISGEFAIYGRNLKKPVTLQQFLDLKDPTLQLDMNFPNGDIEITEFSGDIRLEYDDINFASFAIEEFPKIINQKGTDIRIANPQVYLTVNNPLYNRYQLEALAGVELSPTEVVFEDKLTFDKEVNRYCLSPVEPDNMVVEGSTFAPFPDLGDILGGEDRPSQISINVIDIEVPQQTVHNFVFGEEFGNIRGEYLLYAPASFTDKAEIHYTDTLKELGKDGLDKMTIENVKVLAKVNSTIPLSLQAKAYPIDKDGNNITRDGQPIEAIVQYVSDSGETSDVLPPFVNSSVLIEFIGPIKQLDGILFKAMLKGTKEIHPLKPNQGIQFIDLKLNVTGEYIDEF